MAMHLKRLRSFVVALSAASLLGGGWLAFPLVNERRAFEPPSPAIPAIERDAAEAALRTYGY